MLQPADRAGRCVPLLTFRRRAWRAPALTPAERSARAGGKARVNKRAAMRYSRLRCLETVGCVLYSLHDSRALRGCRESSMQPGTRREWVDDSSAPDPAALSMELRNESLRSLYVPIFCCCSTFVALNVLMVADGASE